MLVLCVVSAVARLSAAPAHADRGVPSVPNTPYGTSFGTFGNHDFCRGAVHFGLSAPANKPGFVRVTLTSSGFTGQGAGWKRNSLCGVLLLESYMGSAGFRETPIRASFGPRRGERVSRLIYTGSGPLNIGVAPYALNSACPHPAGAGRGLFRNRSVDLGVRPVKRPGCQLPLRIHQKTHNPTTTTNT